MGRWRMNWDWLGDPSSPTKGQEPKKHVRITVYSMFITRGKFKTRVMIGDPSAPTDRPRWTGTVTGVNSHEEAFDICSKFAERKLLESGEIDSRNPLYDGSRDK